LDAAQPAVAGERDQQQRGAETRDPEPLLPGLGDGARSAGQHAGERTGEELEEQQDDEPEAEGQPGGLDPLGDSSGTVTGAGTAGGPGGGAVGQEVQQRGRPRQQTPADGEPTERDGAEVTHDGGVDQQVERLRRQHDQRRHGEREDGRAATHSTLSSARRAATVASRST
jgi:hypothetical protein